MDGRGRRKRSVGRPRLWSIDDVVGADVLARSRALGVGVGFWNPTNF